jgi:probable phosphoglycerate mutase
VPRRQYALVVIVHLVRHAQAFNNTHRSANEPSPPNPPLTPLGVQQAERLAARLAAVEVDRLVASPMRRAVETADHVGRAVGRPVELLTICHEHRAGEGYVCWGARELLSHYPTLVVPEDLHPDGWPYGAEPFEGAVDRAEAFANWLREQATAGSGQLLVVTHAAITRLVLTRLLGLEPRSLASTALDNTSLTTLRLDPTAARPVQVLALNDTSHLAGAPGLDPLAGLSR